MEKREVVSKNEEKKNFNHYFNNGKWRVSNKLYNYPFVNAIKKYKNHPNMINAKSSFETTELFDLNSVHSNEVSKTITSLDATKDE